MIRTLLLPVTLLLASCGGPEFRFAVPVVEPGPRIGVSARFVEVREISLPTYASQDLVYVETEDGALVADDSLLWADEPSRAMTLSLSRYLGTVTGARVAAEPWPFDAFPEAQVEVRVDEMVAGRDGLFRLSGQYFVSSPRGGRAEHAHYFDLRAGYDPEVGILSIAAARAQVVRDLARNIASKAL